MKIDWSLALTLVAALFLSSVFNRVVVPKIFGGNSTLQTNAIGEVPENESLEAYLQRKYPDARR